MTKKVFYEKRGRKYVPVSEYNSEFSSSFQHGTHLVTCVPGGSSTVFNIDPALAPLIAAGYFAKDAMITAIIAASELKSKENKKLTPEQHAAWENFVKVIGDEGRCLHHNSYHKIAMAGIDALTKEANKILKYQSVQEAYEHFLLVCKLTQEIAPNE